MAMLRATVLENRWIPHDPTEKQAEFLLLDNLEAFYGGAAGGGKSDALLMAALQFVDVPGYSAILFRRTYTDLALPGALMDRAREWLNGTEAHWHELDKTWSFPSGATLTFGYLEHEKDKYRYQSAEFQFIGFDELTQFTQSQYEFLFSRLRRLEGSWVPLRMRSASNPGGIGHDWVNRRFVDERTKIADRVFVPARLQDNPYIDREAYLRSLEQLDPITRAQMERGEWISVQPGGLFQRTWFRVVEDWPRAARLVRYWDTAATTPSPANPDPDWTVGVLMAMRDGQFWVVDIQRARLTPGGVQDLILQTAKLDGPGVSIRMEQEPGSSGKSIIHQYRRLLTGYDFDGVLPTGDKTVRARPLSAAVKAGNVSLVLGGWVADFLGELEAFPFGSHDDQVDAASGAFEFLTGVRAKPVPSLIVYHDPVSISPV